MSQKRKRILFVTGAITPLHSTNASLMCRVLTELQMRADCDLLSMGGYQKRDTTTPFKTISCVKYSTISDEAWYCNRGSALLVPSSARLLGHVAGRILDRKGYQDLHPAICLRSLIELLCSRTAYDLVVASNEPYPAAVALAQSRIEARKALYLIDPFAEFVPLLREHVTPFRHRTHIRILEAMNIILTTPRVVQAMQDGRYSVFLNKIDAWEFPLFARLHYTPSGERITFDPEKINLLYCGWLRNETFLCRVLERLDNRFCVTFLGNDNARLQGLKTAAELRTLPAVPRATAVNAILDADVLLSTGNPYPVHLPSKTFDYLASGKPVIHFYSIPDCPALEYYRSYPLGLCIPMDAELELTTKQVLEFCLSIRGSKLPFEDVEVLYPELQATHIMEALCERLLDL